MNHWGHFGFVSCFSILIITLHLQSGWSARVPPKADRITLARLGDLVLKDLDQHEEAMVSRFFKALRKRVDERVLNQNNAAESVGQENESRESKLKLNKDDKKRIVKFFTALSKLKKENKKTSKEDEKGKRHKY